MHEVIGAEVISRFSVSSKQIKPDAPQNGIVTTPEELAAYDTIRGVLVGVGNDPRDIVYKDLRNWMNISYKRGGSWFCRLFFNEAPIGILFRLSAEEIAGLLPSGYTAVARGKGSFVEINPRDIVLVSRAIIFAFDSYLKGDVSDSGEDDDTPAFRVA